MSISNLFIIGAGFTRAVFPTAPLNNELLCQVVGLKNNSTLGRVWAEYGSKEIDVEMLLTRFDLDLMTKTSSFSKADRYAISGEIADFVKRFRFEKDVEWLRPFLQTIADNDVIISLNYDCFLEGFLDVHEAWTPNGGYGDIEPASKGLDDSPLDNPRGIRILKIHGSESFRLVPFHDRPESMTLGVVVNEALFPVSGKNKHFGYTNNAGPYVIAPSFMKQFMVELQLLVVEAIRYAKSARNLIIIGCGLRPEDNHLWLVISSFIKHKEWEKKRIFIVSPHASDTEEKIKKVWANRSIFTKRNLIAIDSGLESGLSRLNDALHDSQSD
jgi:SIR2-like domain